MSHQVFISYCKADQGLANAACKALEAAGVPCWIVPRNLTPGTVYSGDIYKAIRQARLAVVIFSAATMNSPHVRAEVRRAFDDGLDIVTFRTDNVVLSDSWDYYLGAHHWVDAFSPPSPEAHLADLVEAIRRRQAEARPNTGKGQRFGNYEVISAIGGSAELGTGWTGQTYEAFDQHRREVVALKVLGKGAGGVGDEFAREAFIKRVSAAEQLRHPHLAAVLGHGIEKDLCYYASEYVEGINLRQRVATRGPLSPAAALLVARQTAEALNVASAAGVVHGNLKPSNLLLSLESRDTQPMVKLTHFWLGRRPAASDAAVDLARGFVTMALPRGEPTFASPEAFEGEELDGRADIFSLGAVLWFLLTGKAPFEATVAGFRHGFFRDPAAVAGMPPAVDCLLRAMLQLNPAKRPRDFATLCDSLDTTYEGLGADEGAGREVDDLHFQTILAVRRPAAAKPVEEPPPPAVERPAVTERAEEPPPAPRKTTDRLPTKPVIPPSLEFPTVGADLDDNSLLMPRSVPPPAIVPAVSPPVTLSVLPPPATSLVSGTGGDGGKDALVFGPFRVLQLPDGSPWMLGRGGMGVTYKAIDANLDRVVALKIINTNFVAAHPSSRERFTREARSAGRLHHPNIAGVLYLGEERGETFYAMEFIDGETVDVTVKRVGPLPPAMVVDIGVQVTSALMAAHRQNLVHRDIKPSNIMLVHRGEDDSGGLVDTRSGYQVKLIDFGLAKSFEEVPDTGLTISGFVGTPTFAAPEQILEEPVDTRSDIYSLGCSLWFMLLGQPPFVGSLAKIFSQHLNVPPPAGQLEAAGVPAPLRHLLAHMLAKSPSSRPQTPAALRAELETIKSGLFALPAGVRPPPARPPVPVASARPPETSVATRLGMAPDEDDTRMASRSASVSPPTEAVSVPSPPPASRSPSTLSVRMRFFPQRAMAPPALAGAGPTDAVADTATDALTFTACLPGRIAPGTSFLLDIWAHTAAQRGEVRARAAELGRLMEAGRKGPVAVTRGTTLVIHVTLAGFTVANPTDAMLWNGEIANSTFAVNAPARLGAGRHPGQAVIRVDGVPIVRLIFEVEVAAAKPSAGEPGAERQFEARIPRTAFASYAEADRDIVLARLQGMRKVCPRLEIFLDVLSLRAGEDWERRLAEQVPDKDVFFLFWSRRAAHSRWVDYEWRLALARRGLNYIDPVPLEGLNLCPPPGELRALHFGESLLAFQRGTPPAEGLFKRLFSAITRRR